MSRMGPLFRQKVDECLQASGRPGGHRQWEVTVNGCVTSLGDDETLTKIECGDGCVILWRFTKNY